MGNWTWIREASSSTPKACMIAMGGKRGDIIHAAGVRVAFPLSAPTAQRLRAVSRGLRREPSACKLVAEIVEVIRADTEREHFLNHWQGISQGANRPQGWCIDGSDLSGALQTSGSL
jgi:hypothetical protein